MSYGGGFWATLDLLNECRQVPMDPFKEDINDWLESVNTRVKMQLERDKLARDTSYDKTRRDEEEADYGSMIDCSLSPAILSIGKPRIRSLYNSDDTLSFRRFGFSALSAKIIGKELAKSAEPLAEISEFTEQ